MTSDKLLILVVKELLVKLRCYGLVLNQLRNLRNTLNGSVKKASGYDANHSYGISNLNIDVEAFTDDAAEAVTSAEQGGKSVMRFSR